MKFGLLLLFMTFGAGVSQSQQVSARISVRSETDVIALHQRGIELADARIDERVGVDGVKRRRVVYCPENGFVTLIGNKDDLQLLRNQGYQLSDVKEISRGLDPVHNSSRLDTIPYQFGWPRTIFNGNSLYENSPTVGDMDRNGQLDVSVTNAWGSYPANPPYLIVWRRNGAYLAGFPVALEAGQLQSSADGGISAMGDILGDNRLEIVCGDENGFLYAFNHDGSPLSGFPVSYGSGMGVYVPALADVDHDGKSEIAVISHQWDSPYGNANLHLLKVTSSGSQEMPGYPINIVRGSENGPSIGDLDGDGEMEIVVGTGGASDGSAVARVIAYTPTGQMKPGFPWVVGRNSVGCNPTLFDIDRDGKLEILVRVKPDSNVNGIYAISHTGALKPGFPFAITYGHVNACVAVGDMTGDGVPELAYGGVEAVDSGKVWVFSLDGVLLPGFPARVFRTWVDGSVAIADVDGDGKGDAVCGTNGVTNKPGIVCAFNYLGQMVEGFPLSPGNPILNSFETHPTVVDIDGDGDTEIFAGRLDKNVYGWSTPGIFDSTKAWTTFKANPARTGGQLRSPVVGVTEPLTSPAKFNLEQNYPNPFNPSTTIRFTLPVAGHATLTIFDVLGREVGTLVNGWFGAGEHAASWSPEGVSSGVYFYQVKTENFVSVKKLVFIQ
jgi:hypothetical protein